MRAIERWKLLPCLLVALVIPLVAEADPVLITSGTVIAWWDGDGSGSDLGGPTVRITAEGRGVAPASWTPGTLGDLDGRWFLQSRFAGFGADVELGDAHYRNVFLDGSAISFDTPSFLVPSSGPLEARFTASGRLVGYARGPFDPAGQGPALFDIDVIGTGLASITPFVVPEVGVLLNRTAVRYEFDDLQAPVPEPGTMLLIGSGLAGVILRRRSPAARARREAAERDRVGVGPHAR